MNKFNIITYYYNLSIQQVQNPVAMMNKLMISSQIFQQQQA